MQEKLTKITNRQNILIRVPDEGNDSFSTIATHLLTHIVIRKNEKAENNNRKKVDLRPYLIWLAIGRCMKTNFIHD